MPAFVTINRVLLVLLGVMTGMTKLLFMDAEMAIFRNAGFPDGATVAFGGVQMASALGCLHRATRTGGALLLAVTFVAATGVLFINGLYAFGFFSLLFPASALFEAYAGRASGSWTCAGGDRCSIGELGLDEDVMDVVLDGANADPERGGNLLVGQAAPDETSDLPLASGQDIEDTLISCGHHDDERDGPRQVHGDRALRKLHELDDVRVRGAAISQASGDLA